MLSRRSPPAFMNPVQSNQPFPNFQPAQIPNVFQPNRVTPPAVSQLQPSTIYYSAPTSPPARQNFTNFPSIANSAAQAYPIQTPIGQPYFPVTAAQGFNQAYFPPTPPSPTPPLMSYSYLPAAPPPPRPLSPTIKLADRSLLPAAPEGGQDARRADDGHERGGAWRGDYQRSMSDNDRVGRSDYDRAGRGEYVMDGPSSREYVRVVEVPVERIVYRDREGRSDGGGHDGWAKARAGGGPEPEEKRPKVVGVGLSLAQYAGVAGIFVAEVVPGFAADLSQGFRVGDEILAVDGTSVEGFHVDDIKRLTMGPPGSQVLLECARGLVRFSFTLRRTLPARPQEADSEALQSLVASARGYYGGLASGATREAPHKGGPTTLYETPDATQRPSWPYPARRTTPPDGNPPLDAFPSAPHRPPPPPPPPRPSSPADRPAYRPIYRAAQHFVPEAVGPSAYAKAPYGPERAGLAGPYADAYPQRPAGSPWRGNLF